MMSPKKSNTPSKKLHRRFDSNQSNSEGEYVSASGEEGSEVIKGGIGD